MDAAVEVKIGGSVEDGIVTFEHRVAAFEFVQQVSVELAEVEAQYAHSPRTFDRNPQLLDSFSAPVMQVTVSESAGRAQIVKSERI